jgi:hypothetical protein
LPPFLAADLRAPPALLLDDFFAAFLADFFFALAISECVFVIGKFNWFSKT